MTPPPALTVTNGHRVNRPSPLVIVAAVTAMVCIAVGALVIGEFAPSNANTAVVTGFVLGTIAPTIMALLALLRGDHAAAVGQANADRLEINTAKIEAVAGDVNGHLTRHDELATKLTDTAAMLGQIATNGTPIARAAGARSRATDGTPAEAPDTTDPEDTAPLAPEQG